MQNEKTTCILFKTLFDAALKLAEEGQKDVALDIFLSYGKYAFGYTEGVEANSLMSELLVKQNVPSLDAAGRKYEIALRRGEKGKENGGGVGRPRKGETKEEYQKRVDEWKTLKNPQKTLDKNPVIEKSPSEGLQNPQKPLAVSVSDAVSNAVSVSVSKSNSLTKDKDITVLENIPIKEKETYKEKEMEKPTKELVQGGSPSSRLSFFKENLDKTYQLPEMEKRLELQYMDILKHLPVYEKMHPGTGEVEDSVAHYTSETCDFFEPLNGETMSYMMLRWFDGGREKMAELVQGLDPKTTKEILTYLVLYCQTLDKNNTTNRFQTVYV